MVRFDKPCVSVTHALNYFKMHMAGDDYLTEQGQAEMVWCGHDAARLGLHGTVQKDDFRKLCEGKHPSTGETLGVRDSRPVRRTCYRRIRIGCSELDRTPMFMRLMTALDNELQHQIMFPHFCKMEMNTKAFYADDDKFVEQELKRDLAKGYKNFVVLLPDFLTAIAPGGAMTGSQREEIIKRFMECNGGAYANSLAAIREAILRWGKGTSYDVSLVLKEIFLAIDDHRARRTWFGFSGDEACFPDGGFFVDAPFEPNELPPVQVAQR